MSLQVLSRKTFGRLVYRGCIIFITVDFTQLNVKLNNFQLVYSSILGLIIIKIIISLRNDNNCSTICKMKHYYICLLHAIMFYMILFSDKLLVS